MSNKDKATHGCVAHEKMENFFQYYADPGLSILLLISFEMPKYFFPTSDPSMDSSIFF